MRIWVLCVLIGFGTVGGLKGQAASPAPAVPGRATAPANLPPPQKLPIVRQIRKTVSFIELTCNNGGTTVTDKGTGFYVFTPMKDLVRAADSPIWSQIATSPSAGTRTDTRCLYTRLR